MRHYISYGILILVLGLSCSATNIVLTNDDGWAVAQIRAEYDALKAAGFNVILSAPAVDKSGTGSSSATPTTVTNGCEFSSCPSGSPAIGKNASDAHLNYVNAFPVDAVRYGIQTLSPSLMGGKPDLVVSGSNVGNNLGSGITGSGTVGAASEAALEGIPSIAFSGSTASSVSYTTLSTNPNSSSSLAAHTYTSLVLKFVNALLANSAPLLPTGVSVNVNFPSTTNCPSPSSFSFVLTRIVANSASTDVQTCGTTHLPDESSTVRAGCFVSVSVFNASTKADVGAATQGIVLNKLTSILTCLPN